MAKDLNWFQARALARVQGRAVRRWAWRKWLEYNRNVYLWFIWQPPGVTVIIEGEETTLEEDRHVVENDEFAAAEFLAGDWTDEPWTNPGDPPATPPGSPGGSGGGINQPPATPPAGPDDEPGADDGAPGAPGSTPTPPPDNSGGIGSDSGGAGTFFNFGGGGGGLGGSGTSGGEEAHGPPPQADYTPAVTVTLTAEEDGPGCFVIVPREGTAIVEVDVPNPEGGTALVIGLSVTCMGQTKTQTVGPGFSGAFTFKGPIGPGGTVRATATARDFNGHAWTGADTDQWAPRCLLPIFTWSGTKDVEHRCEHSSGPDDGFDVEGSYAVVARYAVNPTVAMGTTGELLANLSETPNNKHETTTPWPAGSPSTVNSVVAPPSTITCDVAAGGVISNVSPASMAQYPDSDVIVTGTPPDECTETITAAENGPNGAEP